MEGELQGSEKSQFPLGHRPLPERAFSASQCHGQRPGAGPGAPECTRAPASPGLSRTIGNGADGAVPTGWR